MCFQVHLCNLAFFQLSFAEVSYLSAVISALASMLQWSCTQETLKVRLGLVSTINADLAQYRLLLFN